jgi:hypothetical protein
MPKSLFNKQHWAVRCALSDLIGALQAHEEPHFHVHDWEAHKTTINDLADAFGLEDELPEQFK